MRCAQEQHGGVRPTGPGSGDGGGVEAVAVRSSLGNAVDCTRLRLVWAVSARPRSPGGAGAKMNGWSAYCLWRGAAAAEAGEATESAFSSAVLGSSGCGAAPGSHSLKGKGVAKPQAGAQSGRTKAATCHCGSVFRKT
ncbi:uncharacterized protein VSU04_003354 isoform 2-T5 [Chlamydotis macqueenii]